MVKAGDEIWSVLMADYGEGSSSGDLALRVEFSGATEESAMTSLKSALEKFYYDNSDYSHSFPEVSAAVNAFVDEKTTAFDDDVLNWRKADVDEISILGDDMQVHIVKIQAPWAPGGATQYKCFRRSFELAEVYVVQHSYIEE